MDVRTLLNAKGNGIFTVRPDESIESAVKVLRRHNIGAAIVCAKFGETLGIISERDVIRGLAEHGAAILKREVHELMTYRTISCLPTCDIRSAMEKMMNNNIRHLPVVDENGNLEGMVSMRDLNRTQVELMEAEAAVLKDVATVSQAARVMR
ncbi:MAG: CBS domain-containing protein [Rhodospirillales bacterium]|nr:CBS domain-containing protein [Rhodospirillales bacterium]MCW8862385.1 CBS domain-containing protein [Rhodospirillales bacterium]MCW8951365.1 CBS domain-containing protein [Rhodospirillales bacterium]MCW8970437.1 CBS domain-containing protein [Rhodospirillales bacterium]MCW9001273.1 CBS domain-containing protein [Rhodospirillales bacterium]